MKKLVLTLLVVFFTVSLTAVSYGGEVDDGLPDNLKTKVRTLIGEAEIREVNKLLVGVLYEIVTDDLVFYVSDTGYLIVGTVFDPLMRNLTSSARERVMSARAELLDKSVAIRIGDGPNEVIEFADPDCPFCRRMSQWFASRTDVTRYIFLFPLPIHPDAERKAIHILCSKDPVKEYEKVFSGKYDGNVSLLKRCPEGEKILRQHMDYGQKAGINGTPAYFVNGKFVPGANIALIEQNLKKK